MTSDVPPNMMMRPLALPVVLLLALGAFSALARAGSTNWSQFRGPNGSGVADAFKPPVKVIADQVAWRILLPPGKSSPVFRPELPPEHPGFGLPLPSDPARRKESQSKIFAWRDKDKDGFWTKEEFMADMSVGQGRPILAAIRPGGTGDITESHVSWSLRRGIPEIPSPVFHSGRLYLVRDGGVLSCVNAATGEVIYREHLGAGGQYIASPVIADGHVYLVSSKGVLTVVKCSDEFEVMHQADLEASVAATPAMDQRSLYVRTGEAMLAFR